MFWQRLFLGHSLDISWPWLHADEFPSPLADFSLLAYNWHLPSKNLSVGIVLYMQKQSENIRKMRIQIKLSSILYRQFIPVLKDRDFLPKRVKLRWWSREPVFFWWEFLFYHSPFFCAQEFSHLFFGDFQTMFDMPKHLRLLIPRRKKAYNYSNTIQKGLLIWQRS